MVPVASRRARASCLPVANSLHYGASHVRPSGTNRELQLQQIYTIFMTANRQQVVGSSANLVAAWPQFRA